MYFSYFFIFIKEQFAAQNPPFANLLKRSSDSHMSSEISNILDASDIAILIKHYQNDLNEISAQISLVYENNGTSDLVVEFNNMRYKYFNAYIVRSSIELKVAKLRALSKCMPNTL